MVYDADEFKDIDKMDVRQFKNYIGEASFTLHELTCKKDRLMIIDLKNKNNGRETGNAIL
jgi:hypothetical protein